MLEPTRKVALIVRVPGAPANGRVCREFVEFVDLVPTLGQLVHLDLPGNLEGTSFAPLLDNAERPWKKAVFMVGGSSDPGQVVRTRRHSYLEYRNGEQPALFDLEKDPWETRNVARDPAYAETQRELAALLQAGWRAALPPGVKPIDSRAGNR
jgi:arylsulfatase A-like enzyme